jgi:phosphatidate cytidylyltransferase
MLKQRVLTALILVPLIIWAIFSLPDVSFTGVLLGIMCVAAWEWSRLAGLQQPGPRLFYVVILFLLLSATGFYFQQDEMLINSIYLIVSALWLLALAWLFYYRSHTVEHSGFSVFKLIVGVAIILGPFVALLALRHREPFGPAWIMYLLLLIWVADSGAYFAGKAFGKHKLLYNVSPGKSWEGVLGGLIGCLLLALAAGWWWLGLPPRQYLLFVILSLVVVIFSIAGDLLESLFKRQAGLKDSGHILPGHGGILDRIDSLTAAAPVFVAGLYIMGRYL